MDQADILAAERDRVIDIVIRAAREYGWCSATETALQLAYPDTYRSEDFAGWRDSDGFDCKGCWKDDLSINGVDNNGRTVDGCYWWNLTTEERSRYTAERHNWLIKAGVPMDVIAEIARLMT